MRTAIAFILGLLVGGPIGVMCTAIAISGRK